MKMTKVKAIAKERGIATGRIKKIELIQRLQKEEGNESCYMTGQAGCCGQNECLWREDCA
jgi:hypothetical protein